MTVGVCYPEKYPVEETFQLLKIPWEWYEPGKNYDVVIARMADVPGYSGPLVDLSANDFFQNISDLLNHGEEHLHEPRCEVIIGSIRSLLKKYMVLVEIPPSPWGHPYAVALTHDVDLTSVRKSRWITVGYAAYQCLLHCCIGHCLQFLAARLGWGRDPWVLFDSWRNLEQMLGVRSTFFFVPKAGEPGRFAQPYRAVSYLVDREELQTLTIAGWEAGVHGIDNWIDAREAEKELYALGLFSPGNRTHWLLFNAGSWEALDEAGYSYDTTFGYNDDVGFRAGTLQVYRPERVRNLLELPLHIQDLALFGKFCWAPAGSVWVKTPCLHLSDQAARKYCCRILDLAEMYGGVVTVLWHYENLTPPHDWSETYSFLVKRALSDGAWVTTAGHAVEWFRNRRMAKLICSGDDKSLTISAEVTLFSDTLPPLMVRVHIPENRRYIVDSEYIMGKGYIDIKFNRKSITVSWV